MAIKYFSRTLIIAIFCTAALTAPARAQDVTVSATLNTDTVALDEQALLEVRIEGASTNIDAPALPTLAGFTAYSAGTSQNMSFVNGKFSSSLSFRYALTPKSTGKFTIPPIVVRHGGTAYQTQPLNIEVIGAGKAPSAGSSTPGPDRSVPGQEKGGKNLFVTATVDKPSVYVNEQVTYSFRFYRRIRLLSNPQYVPANFSGFWTEDMPPRNYYATIGGQQYVVTEVKTLLFPTRSGTFNLGAASLQCKIEDFNRGDAFADDFFRNFFSGGKAQVLETAPVTITAMALPETGKPKSFSGAVGQLKVTAALDRSSTRANEPVTLAVTVSGTGNIKTLSLPPLPAWPDFRTYETVSSLNIAKDGDAVKGSKVFKTVIVPQTPGKKTLPALTFSFFDPARKMYVTETTQPLALDVQPGTGGAAAVQAPETVAVINRDIRYIKDMPRWHTARGPLLRTGWFVALNALLPVLLLVAFGYTQRRKRLSTDVAYARRLKASSTAKKYLAHARKLCGSAAPSDFYAAVTRALREYIAHKVNVSADGLTFPAIAAILAERGVPPATIETVTAVLEECDLVRFAPAGTATDMPRTLDTAAGLIEHLEKELK